jgi:Flp pilus assembly protein TadD
MSVRPWLRTGRPGEGEQLVRKALELSPSLAQARQNLVLALEDQGRPDDAAKALAEAIQATGMQPQYEDLARDLRSAAAPPM